MTDQEANQQPQRELSLQRVYLKDTSFETPNSPAIFQQEWKPETNININSEVNTLADRIHEVVLTVTVTTKLGEQTAYLAEVQQAGIFSIGGFPDQEMGPLMGSYCPNLLFPYVREAISDLVTKGSFPQMVLQPINFDALYAQHQQKMAEAGGEATH
ncbi:protein-export chaperone SecB [endosymbiont of Ridgeia piscesae]|jgi:preprotein translocase subunit SecB|uniref:Protein-export protein SecB n=1 Tax=endosymbiont of Ridgeia piscesae TaxID=54398 RepID=A0A0T5Z8E1_9GAMM|nr:protein-export chaperone SecB [endosymbiont of Ridgeia piscesae]KRT53983.1 protein translocase subunit secB [endosymbiont of Ridgeia piscesae]KRT58805.1 protein translocase subunit secB [endosymbiont of Ridgeia piscesae]